MVILSTIMIHSIRYILYLVSIKLVVYQRIYADGRCKILTNIGWSDQKIVLVINRCQ